MSVSESSVLATEIISVRISCFNTLCKKINVNKWTSLYFLYQQLLMLDKTCLRYLKDNWMWFFKWRRGCREMMQMTKLMLLFADSELKRRLKADKKAKEKAEKAAAVTVTAAVATATTSEPSLSTGEMDDIDPNVSHLTSFHLSCWFSGFFLSQIVLLQGLMLHQLLGPLHGRWCYGIGALAVITLVVPKIVHTGRKLRKPELLLCSLSVLFIVQFTW